MTNPSLCCIIITTTDAEHIANSIAEELITQSLAKCVQKDTIQSIYEWESKIIHGVEYRLMIKCTESKADSAMKYIKDRHNYEIPEIIKINIDDGNKEYIKWMTT